MAFFINGALEAYKANRIRRQAKKFDQRIGASSIPLVGGMTSWVSGFATDIFAPVEILGGLVGIHADPEKIEVSELPEGLKNSPLGEAMVKEWRARKESIKLDIDSWQALLSLEIQKSQQLASQAQYVRNDLRHNIMPGQNPGDGAPPIVSAAAHGAALYALAQNPDVISGLLSPSATPSVAAAVVDGITKIT